MIKHRRFVSFFLLVIFPLARGIFPVPIIPRVECFLRFGLLCFDIENYAKFHRYFHNDSQMILAESGVYEGADSIEEYTRFTNVCDSPYTDISPLIEKKIKFVGYNRETGNCEFLGLYHRHYVTTPTMTIDKIDFQTAAMIKLYYSFRYRYIKAVHVYYPRDFLTIFFDYVLNSANTRMYICTIIEGACSPYISSTSDCVQSLAAMPTVDSNGHVEGLSQGCRALHAVFAEKNIKHCPHISFTPMQDEHGRTKCQTTGSILASDLFTSDEFTLYEKFCTKVGLDPTKGHTIVVP